MGRWMFAYLNCCHFHCTCIKISPTDTTLFVRECAIILYRACIASMERKIFAISINIFFFFFSFYPFTRSALYTCGMFEHHQQKYYIHRMYTTRIYWIILEAFFPYIYFFGAAFLLFLSVHLLHFTRNQYIYLTILHCRSRVIKENVLSFMFIHSAWWWWWWWRWWWCE